MTDTGDLSRVPPSSHPMTAGIGSSPHAMLNWIMRLWKMDGWMEDDRLTANHQASQITGANMGASR